MVAPTVNVARVSALPSPAQPNTIYYVSADASKTLIYVTGNDGAPRTLVDADAQTKLAALQPTVDLANATAAASKDLLAAAVSGYSTVGEAIATSGYTTAPVAHRWIVGGDVGAEIVLGGKSVYAFTAPKLYIGAGTTTIRFYLIVRLLSSATVDLAPPQSGDVVFGPYDFSVAALGLTQGAPASDVRLILPIALPSSVLANATVLTDMRGLDSNGNPSPIGPGNRAANDALPNRKRGFFSTVTNPTNLNTVSAGSPIVAWRLETVSLLSGAATNTRLTTLEGGVSSSALAVASLQTVQTATTGLLRTGFSALGTAAVTSNFPAANNFHRWAVGIDVGTDVNLNGLPLSAIPLRLILGTGGTKVRLRLWLRALTSAFINAAPGSVDDTLYLTLDYPISALGLVAGGAAADVRFVLPADILPATLASKCLLVDVEGLDDNNAQVLLGPGSRPNPGGLPARKCGFYFTSAWGNIASDNAVVVAWKLESANTFNAGSNDTRVGAVEARATALEAGQTVTTAIQSALTTTYTSRGEIVRTSVYGPGTYTRWFFGGDVGTEITIAPGQSLTHLFMQLTTYAASTTTKVRLTALLRDRGSSALNTAGQQSGDIAFGPWAFNLADLGLVPGSSQVATDVRMPLGSVGIPQSVLVNKRVYYYVEGLDASGAYSALGVGFTSAATGTLDQGKRGFFGTASLGNAIGSPNAIAWRVEQGSLVSNADLIAALAGGSAATAVAALTAKLDPTITPNFLLPDRLWMTAGRHVPVAIQQMASMHIDQSAFDFSLQSLKYLPTTSQATAPKPGLSVRGNGTLLVDPDALGSSIVVTIRRRGVENTRYGKTIPVTVVPWPKSGSPAIMGLGDSLMAQSMMAALNMELLARGMTPTFLGDIPTNFNGFGAVNIEGRGGKAMADFLNIRTYDSANANTMMPLAGNLTYAQYLALNSLQKTSYNPYLVAGSGAGYFNGFKFSVQQYGAITGKPVTSLTHVFVSLGTNDIFQFTKAAALANIVTGIKLMVAEIRAVAPNAIICFYSDGCGWRDGINAAGQYYETHHAMMQTQQATIATLVAAGDTRLFYTPLGLHEDDNHLGAVASAYISTTGGSANVSITGGTLITGMFVTGSGIPLGTTVVSGATSGGAAVLSANASATATGVLAMQADQYGLQTYFDDTTQAGYVHRTDTNIAIGASVLASLVAATA